MVTPDLGLTSVVTETANTSHITTTMMSFKLSAIKQKMINKSNRLKKSIARFSKKRSQHIKNHLPKSVTKVTLKPIQEEEDFSFLTMEILQQLKNTKRTSRKALHNKKSLKSVIEEAKREVRRDPSDNVMEIRIVNIAENNFEEYVDYEDIVINTFRVGDINSDYIQMV